MKASVEAVTPKIAQNILARNTHNRPLSSRVVATYAADMAAGRWRMNGEPIIIASDGSLLDGQHRLHAVVSMGSAVQMLVVRGVDPGAFDTIDANYTRTAGQILAIKGGSHVNMVASAARMALNYIAGVNLGYPTTRKQVTDFASENPYLSDLAALVFPVKSVMAPSPFLAVAFLSNQKRNLDAEWAAFVHQVATGENLGHNAPALTLRKWALNERKRSRGQLAAGASFCATARAWNAFMRGDAPSHIKVTHTPNQDNCEIVGFYRPSPLRRAA